VSIPNFITLVRIVLVPVIVWLTIRDEMLMALYVFVFAGLTDAADGYIATKFDQKTELGAYLDAIADKLLLVSVYVVLGFANYIPAWLVILVVSRDLLIVGAIMLSRLMGHDVEVKPLFVSKANTTAQIVLAALVLAQHGLDLNIYDIIQAGYFAVAGLTIASGVAYGIGWVKEMARLESEEASGGE